jgi:hypothetical protein
LQLAALLADMLHALLLFEEGVALDAGTHQIYF